MSENDKPVGPAGNAEQLFDPEPKPDPRVKVLVKQPRANDPERLKDKEVSDKELAIEQENDLRAVLASPAGVRFVARIIGGPCGWNMPYFNPSNSVMCEIAGRRSIGRQLEEWISEADLRLWFAVRAELQERYQPKPEPLEKGPRVRAATGRSPRG